MGVNQVIYDGQELINLRNDTVTENDVKQGVTFHSADGEARVGTASGGGAEIKTYHDADVADAIASGELKDGDTFIVDDDFDEIKKSNPYSTDEVIIGSFLGKPLYRKVVSVNVAITTSTWTDVCNIQNIERVVFAMAYATSGDMLTQPLKEIAIKNNLTVRVQASQNRTINLIALEYTKITD